MLLPIEKFRAEIAKIKINHPQWQEVLKIASETDSITYCLNFCAEHFKHFEHNPQFIEMANQFYGISSSFNNELKLFENIKNSDKIKKGDIIFRNVTIRSTSINEIRVVRNLLTEDSVNDRFMIKCDKSEYGWRTMPGLQRNSGMICFLQGEHTPEWHFLEVVKVNPRSCVVRVVDQDLREWEGMVQKKAINYCKQVYGIVPKKLSLYIE
jgi:hypothetical protein